MRVLGFGQWRADREALLTLFTRLEFNTWLEELLGDAEPAAEAEQADGDLRDRVWTEADFDRWLERLTAAEVFAFDTETTSLDYMEAAGRRCVVCGRRR